MSGRAVALSLTLSLLALGACGGGDDPPASSSAGAAGTTSGGGAGTHAAGNAGSATAGSAGATTGGTAGATTGGTAGASAGGTAGASAGGTAGSATAGTAGATTAGNAGATAAGNAGSGGGTPPIARCEATCASSADCGTPGAPILSSSHYSCDAGICVWRGCATDLECQDTFHKSNYACDVTTKLCVQTCAGAADCATGGVQIYDADHYSCAAGRCEWKGCKSDGECQQALGKATARCAALPGGQVPTCVPGCATADDCATPGLALYAADHWACESGRCDWKGCGSDAECKDALQKPSYVCK